MTQNVIDKNITESTDLNYLNKLNNFVDIDIANIGKNSDVMEIILTRENMSVDEIHHTIEKQNNDNRKGLLKLKTLIENRISELYK